MSDDNKMASEKVQAAIDFLGVRVLTPLEEEKRTARANGAVVDHDGNEAVVDHDGNEAVVDHDSNE